MEKVQVAEMGQVGTADKDKEKIKSYQKCRSSRAGVVGFTQDAWAGCGKSVQIVVPSSLRTFDLSPRNLAR